MSEAEIEVFSIEDLRRFIFSFLHPLPLCTYCRYSIAEEFHYQTLFNEPICSDCMMAIEDNRNKDFGL